MIDTEELIDRNKITFEPIEIYNIDEHKHEITGMALFKDVEKIPTIKAIPLDEVKRVIEKIQKLRGLSCNCSDGIIDDVEDILDELIKEYESEGE